MQMAKVPYSEIVEKHVVVSQKRGFWPKEVKLLKLLIEKYPDIDFWKKTQFRPKLQSLAQLMAAPLDESLRAKYRDYHRVFEKDEDVTISDKKSGKDIVKKIKPKSIRSFLNG